MFEKFDWMIGRHQELSVAIGQPEIIADTDNYQKLLKEHAALEPAVAAYEAYQQTLAQLEEAKEISGLLRGIGQRSEFDDELPASTYKPKLPGWRKKWVD